MPLLHWCRHTNHKPSFRLSNLGQSEQPLITGTFSARWSNHFNVLFQLSSTLHQCNFKSARRSRPLDILLPHPSFLLVKTRRMVPSEEGGVYTWRHLQRERKVDTYQSTLSPICFSLSSNPFIHYAQSITCVCKCFFLAVTPLAPHTTPT